MCLRLTSIHSWQTRNETQQSAMLHTFKENNCQSLKDSVSGKLWMSIFSQKMLRYSTENQKCQAAGGTNRLPDWLRSLPIYHPAVNASGPPALCGALLWFVAPQYAPLLAPTNLFLTLMTASQLAALWAIQMKGSNLPIAASVLWAQTVTSVGEEGGKQWILFLAAGLKVAFSKEGGDGRLRDTRSSWGGILFCLYRGLTEVRRRLFRALVTSVLLERTVSPCQELFSPCCFRLAI